MRLFQKEHVFLNDWGTITSAFWVKYPNELQPHVLRVDTLDLQIDEEKQEFVCRRLLSLKYQCPKWVQKFFGASPVGFAIEEATCSLKDRKLTLKSCNYTFSSFFRVEEACEYSPHPNNPQHTLYKQTATYKVSGLGLPVNRAVENAAVAQAAEKSLLGVSVVERLGTFLAEQQWRECCSSCLLTLEEAAANASKHAQEKYRQLRQRVEEKLGVAGQPTDGGSNPNEQSDTRLKATSIESHDAARQINVAFSLRSDFSTQEQGASPEVHATSNLTRSGLDSPMLASRSSFSPTQTQYDKMLRHDTAGGIRIAGDRRTVSAELNDEADCPCRLTTPSGRRPAPTSSWKYIGKKLQDASVPDFRSPVSPGASSAAVPSRSGTVDFTLVVRDAVAAAQCQQQHQRRPQAMDWREGTPSCPERHGTTQENPHQERRLNRCHGLLLSSLGSPTKL